MRVLGTPHLLSLGLALLVWKAPWQSRGDIVPVARKVRWKAIGDRNLALLVTMVTGRLAALRSLLVPWSSRTWS